MREVPKNAKGAWCTIKYHDEDGTLSPVFFSFGEYDEETNPNFDSFGHRDDAVFFYTTPEEFPQLMTEGTGDFVVVSVDEFECDIEEEPEGRGRVFHFSSTCRWGGCSNETAHIVRHPVLGFVEACGSCVEGWELGQNVIGDVEGDVDAGTFVVNVLNSDWFERALEIKGMEVL